ncbi:MAG: hypothetical protein WAN65_01785 [Candidatus Sulfotelmatobacter sp.]
MKILEKTGRVDYSAQVAGLDTSTLYQYRKAHPDFRQAWEEAIETAGDNFEAEAVRRGVEGVEEPVFYKGEIVGYVLKYSDTLLSKLLDGAKPGKYRPQPAQLEGGGNVKIGIAIIPMTIRSLEEWEKGYIAPQNGAPMIEGKAVEVKPEDDTVSPRTTGMKRS